jgi:hypothetical protein
MYCAMRGVVEVVGMTLIINNHINS